MFPKEGIGKAYVRKILTINGSKVKWEDHADLVFKSNPILTRPSKCATSTSAPQFPDVHNGDSKSCLTELLSGLMK